MLSRLPTVDAEGKNAIHRLVIKVSKDVSSFTDKDIFQKAQSYKKYGVDRFKSDNDGKIPYDYMTEEMKELFPVFTYHIEPENRVTAETFFKKGIFEGNIRIVKDYLNGSSDMNVANEKFKIRTEEQFPLEYLFNTITNSNRSFETNEALLELLIDAGADVDQTNNKGLDVMQILLSEIERAPENKQNDLIKLIYNLTLIGINCNYQNPNNKNTVLHSLTENAQSVYNTDKPLAVAYMEAAKFIVEKGTNVNLSTVNIDNKTAADIITIPALVQQYKYIFENTNEDDEEPFPIPERAILETTKLDFDIPEVFDPIMYETTDPESFLDANPDNIIFVMSSKSAIGFERDGLRKFTESAYYFECKAVNDNVTVKLDLVENKVPYMIIPGNQNYYVKFAELMPALDSENRIFNLTQDRKLIYTASIRVIRVKNNLNYLNEEALHHTISADHCQEGSDKNTYKITIVR